MSNSSFNPSAFGATAGFAAAGVGLALMQSGGFGVDTSGPSPAQLATLDVARRTARAESILRVRAEAENEFLREQLAAERARSAGLEREADAALERLIVVRQQLAMARGVRLS